MSGGHARAGAACPACASAAAEPIFALRGIPVHAILTLRARASADAFPTGDLDLLACPACGLIWNPLFDPSTQRFGPDYEETQRFSPRFQAFQASMASRLIARHGLRGKRIIEIGCGKGDFLRLLCRLGHNTGIGFDPAWVPRGDPVPGADFVAESYGPKHAGMKADLICCNMTLEHIADPLGFLRMIRANIDATGRPVLFFMVPDATRLLREAAFWDVYYEHCNYFTPGSLARLFSLAGFDVEWLGLEFEDQYAAIEARPAATGGKTLCPGPAHPGDTLSLAHGFRDRVALSVRCWRDTIRRWRAGGKRIAVWGGGSKAVAFLGALGPDAPADAVIDINPHRQGSWLPRLGLRVDSPNSLRQLRPDAVIVMNPAYRDEIREHLSTMGLQPATLALGDRPEDPGHPMAK